MKTKNYFPVLLFFILLFTGCSHAAEQKVSTPAPAFDYSKMPAVTKLKGSAASEFLPDGKLILTRDIYRNLSWLYEVSTGKQIAELKGGNHPNFSPDGKRIITHNVAPNLARNSDEPLISWLYEVSTGKQIAELKGNHPKFSPDGKLITIFVDIEELSLDTRKLIATYDSKEKIPWLYVSWLYEASTGKLLAELKGKSSEFSPDGKRLVTRDYGQISWLYEVSTGKQTKLKGYYPEFSPDSKLLAISVDDVAQILNLERLDEK